MTDHPADDIDEFMADLRAWTSSTQRFARKIQALSQLQRSRSAELRIEAEEAVQRIQSRRYTDQDVQDLVQALRRQRAGSSSHHGDG
ncbi:hypothetical protein [Azospirillum sp. BE72]|uniref:hypothetical protein n=1 Tax=Azospirillum sp. BE72 TaxID=2817776 RepID=UPI0028557C01|nr:hypothetical protein [Azospirillum sp. BE72]MDR6775722.1 Flp pilus assembly protein TadB [Azospirillum sp. BE72]